ncbi:hypothetical protein MSSAC_0950 [Methanosarcina siciliae C2J]|uniref:Uncharacterized protein n=1 Tax=Methanosarcina siciliae C2J TaxID=1434118 RepID=A0A0E3PM90_9EURY|nr:hypothetical protein [Methanosarcina siciliae]AKB35540.1 hypothetical protein MSSAC_0950 [Methanosarcina siciliae C2J]
MDTRCVRDFIYIDIDRVKSIISQLEEGLIDQTEILSGSSEGSTLSGEGGLIGIFKAEADLNLNFHRQLSETKSLHDYIYNKVEKLLLSESQLLRIPNEEFCVYSEKLRNSLSDTSFILIRGKIAINDFSQLRKLVSNFAELSKFIARCSIAAKTDLSKSQAKLAYDNLVNDFNNNFDKNTKEGLILVFDMFYQDRTVVKIFPFRDNLDFRFVGNLNKSYLRDDIESIIYKYGTEPVSYWVIFGQIASIPPKNRSNKMQEMTGNQIEKALHGLFDANREIEKMAQSVTFPEIAITPIAIYRE